MALNLALIFWTLAPMMSIDRIRQVAEGIDQKSREEAAPGSTWPCKEKSAACAGGTEGFCRQHEGFSWVTFTFITLLTSITLGLS